MIRTYDPSTPSKSLELLVEIYKNIRALPDGYWRDEKLKETTELIRACSGLSLEATVPEAYLLRNHTVPVTLRVVNRSPVNMAVNSVSLNRQDTSWQIPLQTGVNYSLVRLISVQNLPISQPYWLVEPMSPGSYNVPDQSQIGCAENPPVLEALFNIQLYGESVWFRQRVYYKYTDAVKGELFAPVTIIPSEIAYCDPDLLIFTRGKEKELIVRRQLKTVQEGAEAKAVIHPAVLSSGEKSSLTGSSLSITQIPGFRIRDISVSPNVPDFEMTCDLAKDQNGGTWVTHFINGVADTLLQCRTITYEHIPRIDYFKPARSTVVSVNLKIRGTRIGYIEGAGDRVPDALAAMGYTVVKLSEGSITKAGLLNLDAVITGVRAYDVHDWLSQKYEILMEYIKNGGNLIVQYNRNRGTDTTGIGPYPFGISNARVTEEDAPVRFLLPAHQALHFPNEITDKDFLGWIQERGIYFGQHIDGRYQTLFSMHDKDEPDQTGSLITGRYGKGSFTYTGLVFFRELPAGVPGAYRLLANLIALNQSGDK
jgi:hypothetical protein